VREENDDLAVRNGGWGWYDNGKGHHESMAIADDAVPTDDTVLPDDTVITQDTVTTENMTMKEGTGFTMDTDIMEFMAVITEAPRTTEEDTEERRTRVDTEDTEE
jgi:hypothetical protein